MTSWVLSKVHETASEFEYIEKEDLFAKVHTERTEISRDLFFAVLGRVMGQTPFANVIPYKKNGKAIGYKYLSYKTEENENSKFKSSQQKKIHKKEKGLEFDSDSNHSESQEMVESIVDGDDSDSVTWGGYASDEKSLS